MWVETERKNTLNHSGKDHHTHTHTQKLFSEQKRKQNIIYNSNFKPQELRRALLNFYLSSFSNTELGKQN